MLKIDQSKLRLQTLTISQFKELMQWAADEGWNPGLVDDEIFFNTDPKGHIGYFLDDELIAGGSIVSYEGKFGFMGLFIVKPLYRGEGIGRELWYKRRDLLLQRLDSEAAIGMDGVVAMQPFYARGGFRLAFRDLRYELRGRFSAQNPSVFVYSKSDEWSVIDYDSACFGVRRDKFMKAWLDQPSHWVFIYKKENKIKGFAVLRKTISGYKIGPLFADHQQEARALLNACLNQSGNEAVYLDIPENQPKAAELIKEYGGKYVFECARMYYGHPPKVKQKRIYGITSFELG